MSNEKDWKELENWSNEQKLKEESQYGLNLKDYNYNSANKKLKVFNISYCILKKILKTFGIIIILLAIIALISYIYQTKINSNVNVKKSIESIYHIKVKIINKDVEDIVGNGKYSLVLKDEEDLNFIALKNYGSFETDYEDRAQKYYFDHWNNKDKSYFFYNENINEKGLLTYENYMVINSIDELEKGIDLLIDFKNSCQKHFLHYWNIYLIRDNHRIYPFEDDNDTKEKMMDKAKSEYLKYFKD